MDSVRRSFVSFTMRQQKCHSICEIHIVSYIFTAAFPNFFSFSLFLLPFCVEQMSSHLRIFEKCITHETHQMTKDFKKKLPTVFFVRLCDLIAYSFHIFYIYAFSLQQNQVKLKVLWQWAPIYGFEFVYRAKHLNWFTGQNHNAIEVNCKHTHWHPPPPHKNFRVCNHVWLPVLPFLALVGQSSVRAL